MNSVKYDRSLVIFRRDLRLFDQNTLTAAVQQSKKILTCFILDPEQIKGHVYKSERAFQFMLESLSDLSKQIKDQGGELKLFETRPKDIVEEIIQKEKIQAIFVHRDFTPFSQKRDRNLKSLSKRYGVDFHQINDVLYQAPEGVLKDNGEPYTVYTPYSRKAFSKTLPKLKKVPKIQFSKWSNKYPDIQISSYRTSNSSRIKGGRKKALKILSNLKNFQNYQKERDVPELDATTHLSAHLKFGTISPREFFLKTIEELGEDHPLCRQILWRDFLTQIGFHFPYVLGNAFKRKYDEIPWTRDRSIFQAWKEGVTGFPIVDAGMRELNETGFMHNRLRMITASFLVKDLRIDWRWGEKYFATQLVDYDPLVNNGNWQWAASTGCDAQPYFRIFNPWLQQKKFDPDTHYIKKWIPELKDLSSKEIHRIENQTFFNCDYPRPMVDHKTEARRTIDLFKSF